MKVFSGKIKVLWILLLQITLYVCTSTQTYSHTNRLDSETTIKSNHRSTKIHNQTDVFIDIEAHKDNVWIECPDTDPSIENKTLLLIYVLSEDLLHKFHFRRIMDLEWCLGLEEDYKNLLEEFKRAHFVGIGLNEYPSEEIPSNIPSKFKKPGQMLSWIFIRINTEEECDSYFEHHCEPEGYWGDTFPYGIDPNKAAQEDEEIDLGVPF